MNPTPQYGKIHLQDTNSACGWNHSGARGSAKAYAGGGLRRAIEWTEAYTKVLFDGVQLPVYRGFESRRALQNVSPVVWFVLRDAKRTVHEIVCENVFIMTFVIIRQSEKRLGLSRGAMQKQALPENGYRVIPSCAKRSLSALCRRHSNFQPLLLHG